jgi:hypothetical protein
MPKELSSQSSQLIEKSLRPELVSQNEQFDHCREMKIDCREMNSFRGSELKVGFEMVKLDWWLCVQNQLTLR